MTLKKKGSVSSFYHGRDCL